MIYGEGEYLIFWDKETGIWIETQAVRNDLGKGHQKDLRSSSYEKLNKIL